MRFVRGVLKANGNVAETHDDVANANKNNKESVANANEKDIELVAETHEIDTEDVAEANEAYDDYEIIDERSYTPEPEV